MPIIRAQVSLGSATNRPEDAATNTFHFNTTGNAGSVLENQLDLLEDLYAGTDAVTGLMRYMAADLSNGNYQIKLYDLADPLPRQPLATRVGNRNPGNNAGLPAEVALVASFSGEPVSGVPQARRRGRVFVPFLAETYNAAGRPTTLLVDGIGAEFTLFAAAADASLQVTWIVYSPTDDAGVGVVGGWIDNAWDTQRRRGFAPTTRRLFP